MSTAGNQMRREQISYQKKFNTRINPTPEHLREGSFVFIRNEQYGTLHKQKLSPVAYGPSRAISVGPQTVVLRIGEEGERVSRHPVVEAPPPASAFASQVLTQPVTESTIGSRK